ncbi:MAG TPA: hypothetical protein VIF82_17350 [Burkholderiaceae bacterium]|jgi:hypothetical protein
MKRTIFACLITLGLAACGGYTTVPIGGTVSSTTNNPGQTISGLVLALNGSPYPIATFPADGTLTKYVFPEELDDTDAQYIVTVQTQPAGWNCVVASGTGYTSGIPIDAANVTCAPLIYTLGGVVHNLTSTGLVLANGSDTVAVSPNSGAPGTDVTFTFPTDIATNSTYTVTFATQPNTPTTQTCVINSGGTGSSITANVTNIDITCN